MFLTDIDECEDVRLCAYGQCINTEGSFQCQCYPGYQRTQEGSHCEGTTRSFTSALTASWQQPHQSSFLFLFVPLRSMSAKTALMVYKPRTCVVYTHKYMQNKNSITKREWYISPNITSKITILFYTFFFPWSFQTSMNVKDLRTARGGAVSTAWARTTASARRATCWLEDGDAKVSAPDIVFFDGLRAASNQFMCKNYLFLFVCLFLLFDVLFHENLSVSRKVLYEEESALKTVDLNVTQSYRHNAFQVLKMC